MNTGVKLATENGLAAEDARDRLLTGNLLYLMALEANGLKRAASELVKHIDRGLTRKPSRRDRAWRANQERRRVAEQNAAASPPPPDHAIQRDLRALAQAEADAVKARADADAAWKLDGRPGHREAMARLKSAQGRIRVLRRDIDAARQAQIDRRWAETANDESEALAKLRGEDIEEEATEVPEWVRDPETGALAKGEDGQPVLRTDRARAKRVLSRSGLDLAFVKGDLGEGVHNPVRLREIGRAYAAAYQAASAQLTPDAHEVRGTGIPEPQLATLAHWNALAIMRGERAAPGVQLVRLSPKQRGVLDRVCGRGLSVGAAAREMKASVPSVRRALRAGLDVAGENIKAASAKKFKKAA